MPVSVPPVTSSPQPQVPGVLPAFKTWFNAQVVSRPIWFEELIAMPPFVAALYVVLLSVSHPHVPPAPAFSTDPALHVVSATWWVVALTEMPPLVAAV